MIEGDSPDTARLNLASAPILQNIADIISVAVQQWKADEKLETESQQS